MTDDEQLAAYAEASQCDPGYMDFARIGPLLKPVSEARESAQQLLAVNPDTVDDLDPLMSSARVAAATLLAVDSSLVTLVPNTSTALFQAAFGLGAGTILVCPFDFPANTQPWLRAQERGGPAVRWIADPTGPRPHVTPELIAAALTRDVTAVTVSAVDFATGDCVDLAGIRQAIGDRLLIVDAIQAFSVVDLPWATADIVASGGQKWVRGGWSTGIMYCSEAAADRLGTGLAGWPGVDDGGDPRTVRPTARPRTGVDRFAITAPDMIATAGFAAALDIVNDTGVGAIERKITKLTGRLRDGLANGGLHINGHAPEQAEHSSGIVSFTAPDHPASEIVTRLADAQIRVSERAGAVRVSVHASTDEASIDRLIDVVRAQS